MRSLDTIQEGHTKLQSDNNSLSQSPQMGIDGQTVAGLIAGVVQVNVRIPGDAKSGSATLRVGVGNYGAGATVAMR
jgi:hypothetical protein